MPGKRLAIVTTHPIQYYAPLFRELARSTVVEPRVYYTYTPFRNQNYLPNYDSAPNDFNSLSHWTISGPKMVTRAAGFDPARTGEPTR